MPPPPLLLLLLLILYDRKVTATTYFVPGKMMGIRFKHNENGIKIGGRFTLYYTQMAGGFNKREKKFIQANWPFEFGMMRATQNH